MPSEIVLRPLLEIVAWLNTVALFLKPNIMPLYEYARRGAIKYIREPMGEETFNGVSQVLRNGGGDCNDLCCWRIAELRLRGSLPYWPNGEQAEFRILKFEPQTQFDDLLYHVQARRPVTPDHPNAADPFLIEDPAVLLGMPAPRGSYMPYAGYTMPAMQVPQSFMTAAAAYPTSPMNAAQWIIANDSRYAQFANDPRYAQMRWQ